MLLLHHCLLILLVYITPITFASSLYAREPDQRSYYTLYIPSGNRDAAIHVAQQLDARYEGHIGELEQYHEISIPSYYKNKRDLLLEDNQDDMMVKRFEQLKQENGNSPRHKRQSSHLLVQVESLRPQTTRRRRLVKRMPPTQLYHHHCKRQDMFQGEEEEEDDDSPVVENIQQEQWQNALSAQEFLTRPDGFQTLKRTLAIEDPGFDQQWHLINQEQHGHDLNVTGVWSQGITGKNVVVAILDDGLDMDNDDLKDNFFAAGSYDFNDHSNLPKPKLPDDTHGTRCAGEIAAVKNGVCGVGMAYEAKVAGVRILSADITDEDEARALNYKYQENHIYSCSWGPPDYGEVAEAPQGIVLDAIKNGIKNGRNGTGTIFVFASGNGGGNDDNCNFDGYTNSIYTITVGAIDRLGNHPYYAERCSAQLVVTYSSGSGGNIYTTDIGQNKCTDRHGGTSAAAPLAAGVFALVLSVRSDLTWRDMQHLCVQTALPLSLEDDDWTLLPSGRMYNHKFGYGKLDAYAIVEKAKYFENVREQTYLQVSAPKNKRVIPDRSATIGSLDDLTDTITITQDMVDNAGISRLEHVTVTVYIEHGRRGDLEVLLESPQNVTSQLGAPRKYDISTEGLIDWTFMTVKHWEEEPVGDWTLRIIDWRNPKFTGSFTNWTLTLWGEMVEEMEGEVIHFPEPVTTTSTTIPFNNVPNTSFDHESSTISSGSNISQEQSASIEPTPITTISTVSLTETTTSPIIATVSSLTDINHPTPLYPLFDDDMDTIISGSIPPANDSTSSTSVSYYLFVGMVGLVAATLSWMIRRRIKGPGNAKDITAYTNVSQQAPSSPRNSLIYEFDILNQQRLSQQHPSLSEDDHACIDDDDDTVTHTLIAPAHSPPFSESSSRHTGYPMTKRLQQSSYHDKGK
ncbi:subtilase [Halteromyces radiatus]|uniref:subtilase n=1 Tax=Halteromyces radiatus TaxID=101107 RepID=UPI0022208537|nr:subtilase [Halteromyces radiatus]KAI8096740.1 subtilase [Halteromyces radiatus]